MARLSLPTCAAVAGRSSDVTKQMAAETEKLKRNLKKQHELNMRWVRQQPIACSYSQHHRGSSTVPGQGKGGFEQMVGRGPSVHS